MMTTENPDMDKLCIHTITTKPWNIEEAAKNFSSFSQSRCATLTHEPPITAGFLESTSLGWRHLRFTQGKLS